MSVSSVRQVDSPWRYIFTIEQVLSTTTVWTWDGGRGGKLKVVRLWLRMLWTPPVADKTNGVTIILLLLLLSSPFYIRPSDGNGMTKVPRKKN